MVRLESNRSPRPSWHSRVWRGAAQQRFLGTDRTNEWLNLNAKHTLKSLILKHDNANRSKFVLSASRAREVWVEGYLHSGDTVGASLAWSTSENTHTQTGAEGLLHGKEEIEERGKQRSKLCLRGYIYRVKRWPQDDRWGRGRGPAEGSEPGVILSAPAAVTIIGLPSHQTAITLSFHWLLWCSKGSENKLYHHIFNLSALWFFSCALFLFVLR